MNFLLNSLEHEHATTAKVLDRVPDSGAEYTPDPKSMTAGNLAWHIASAELFFMTGIADGEFPKGGDRPESVKTPKDVAQWYRQAFPQALEKLKALSGEDLVRVIDFHGIFKMPALVYTNLMINHTIHHRGQLSAYLRPMGVGVPSIYGGSADEPISTPASA